MKSFSELPDITELQRLWRQKPITLPDPQLELTNDSWVERGAEVLGWHFCRLEHWLSDSGWLRAWLRLNLILSIALTVAGVFLLPPVDRVLEQVANSSHWVGQILTDLLTLLSSVPPAIISVAVIYLLFLGYRRVRRFRIGRSRGEGYYE